MSHSHPETCELCGGRVCCVMWSRSTRLEVSECLCMQKTHRVTDSPNTFRGGCSTLYRLFWIITTSCIQPKHCSPQTGSPCLFADALIQRERGIVLITYNCLPLNSRHIYLKYFLIFQSWMWLCSSRGPAISSNDELGYSWCQSLVF